MKFNKPFQLFVYMGLLLLACAGVSLLTIRLTLKNQFAPPESHLSHQWLHDELDLSDQEVAELEAFEQGYQMSRQVTLREFHQRTADLAQLLATTGDLTPEVETAIHDLHIVHGQLQELSIRHYYQMLSVLSPEDQTKLRAIAVEALSIPE